MRSGKRVEIGHFSRMVAGIEPPAVFEGSDPSNGKCLNGKFDQIYIEKNCDDKNRVKLPNSASNPTICGSPRLEIR
jgi:hypothetical protein